MTHGTDCLEAVYLRDFGSVRAATRYSFESFNYPAKYIRHYDFVAHIASDGGSNRWDTTSLWAQDTSWLAASPWA